MKDNNVWDLVKLPKGKKPIGYKWVFKIRQDTKDNVERYKARLVTEETEGINYKETFFSFFS